jgi:regulator of sirC expression with transglutaminase-like and TPR domain
VARTYRAGVSESEAVFRQLVADPASDPPLDEGAALIAAVGSDADVGATLARLDDLAAGALAFADARTAAGLAHVLFVDWAFAGNTEDYGDPRNSYLPDVMDRRLGLPITLAVLMIEVGRRIGVGLTGIAMPGHFLVGVVDDPECFVDPFHAGAVLDRDGCRARFAALHGPGAPFRDDFLAPTSARLVLLRMLANLQQTFVTRRSADARWAARLRLAFPELPAEERRRSADVLASVGAFDEAASVIDALVADTPDDAARDALGRQALGYRARSN